MGTEGKTASSTAVQAKCKGPVDGVKNMRASSHCQRELSTLCCSGDWALSLKVSSPQHQTEGNTSYSQPPPPDLNLWCKNIHASQSDPRSSTCTWLESTSVDCNRSRTKDPAVGQMSSRDTQTHSFS